MPEKMKEYTTRGGERIMVDISDEACKPFGFFHGQKVETPHGEATVAGVAKCLCCLCEGKPKQLWFYLNNSYERISFWGGKYSKEDFIAVGVRPLKE